MRRDAPLETDSRDKVAACPVERLSRGYTPVLATHGMRGLTRIDCAIRLVLR